MNERISWIDYCKALGIIFVVLGHTTLPEQMTSVLYSFHMPLFFFIAGLTFKIGPKITFKKFAEKRFKTLLLPYLFFAMTTYLFWLFVGRKFGEDATLGIDPIQPLIGIFYSVHVDYFLVFNSPLWFLTCLFATQILFYGLAHFSKRNAIISVILFSAIGVIFSFAVHSYGLPRPPWSLDCMLLALSFLTAGYYLKEYLKTEHKKSVTLGLGIAFYAICIGITMVNGRVDFSTLLFNNVALFYVAAFAGTLGTVAIAKAIPKNKVMDFLGQNSLTILGFHMVAGSLIKGVLSFILHVNLSILENSVLPNIIFSAATMLALAPAILILRRFCPWLIGVKPAKGNL